MTSNSETVNAASCCSVEFEEGGVMSHCPMAAHFDEIIANSKLRQYLRFIGVALLILGVVIVVEPKILVWLIGAVSVLMGIALLMMAHYLGRMKLPI